MTWSYDGIFGLHGVSFASNRNWKLKISACSLGGGAWQLKIECPAFVIQLLTAMIRRASLVDSTPITLSCWESTMSLLMERGQQKLCIWYLSWTLPYVLFPLDDFNLPPFPIRNHHCKHKLSVSSVNPSGELLEMRVTMGIFQTCFCCQK